MKIIIYILIIFSISQVKLKSDEFEFIPMKDLAIYNEIFGKSLIFLLGPHFEFPLFSFKTEDYFNHQLNYRVGASIFHASIPVSASGSNYTPLGFQYYIGKDNYYVDLGFELYRVHYAGFLRSTDKVNEENPNNKLNNIADGNGEFINSFNIGFRYQADYSIFKASIYLIKLEIQYIPWISLSFGYNIP